MKLLIDNALSPSVAALLCDAGHDAVHVRDLALASASDEVIFDQAASDGRVIVQADTDFGMLLALRGSAAPSVILLRRTSQRRPTQQAALLLSNLPAVEDDLAEGSLVVFGENRIRVRRLPIGRG